MIDHQKISLSLWASGTGTNVENIIRYFSKHKQICVSQVIVSHPHAQVIVKAIKSGIPYHVISRAQMKDPVYILPLLYNQDIQYIALAGFLWKIPQFLINAYPNKIINIHPALLPKYGGKNMYGDRVHNAVLKNAERETGITIHYVNEVYDEGEIILQKTCPVEEQDTIESIKRKVHKLEYEWYPRVLESILTKNDIT